jgi:hypothetical protein
MNVEIGDEAAQFPEKEYIYGIAFAVRWWGDDGNEVAETAGMATVAALAVTTFVQVAEMAVSSRDGRGSSGGRGGGRPSNYGR